MRDRHGHGCGTKSKSKPRLASHWYRMRMRGGLCLSLPLEARREPSTYLVARLVDTHEPHFGQRASYLMDQTPLSKVSRLRKDMISMPSHTLTLEQCREAVGRRNVFFRNQHIRPVRCWLANDKLADLWDDVSIAGSRRMESRHSPGSRYP